MSKPRNNYLEITNITINKLYQKLAHDFPHVFVGTKFVTIDQAGETVQYSKYI